MSSKLVVNIVNEFGHNSITINDGCGRQLNVSLADGIDDYVAREVVKYVKIYDNPMLVGDQVAIDVVDECVKRELT